MLVHDQKNDPAAVEIEKRAARSGDSLAIELNGGGGFIARFSKN